MKSLQSNGYKWVGTLVLAAVLAIGTAGIAGAQGLDTGGNNPSDCDWETLFAAHMPDIHESQTDRAEYAISWGDVSIDPQTFALGDTITITLNEGNSTDNAVFATDLDCNIHIGTDDRNYWGPNGATEWIMPDDCEDCGGDLQLGVWYFIDGDNETMRPFLVLENMGPQGPNLSLGVEGNTYDEEGGDIILSANDDMIAGGSLQWKKDGSDIGGETGATFAIEGAVVADSGSYTLDFDDGTKAIVTSNPVGVAIFPAGSLPVSGLLGLTLLGTGLLAGGVALVRRKKA